MNRSWWVAALVLAIGAAACYAPVVWDGTFQFDDRLMLEFRTVAEPDGWKRLFRVEVTRPLTIFSFWLNYRVAGQNAWLWHLVNALLHGANVLLATGVFRRLLPGASNAAWITAAVIFAFHPLQVESVAYVFSRSTLISTLFVLASLHLWLSDRRWWAVGAFALAILGKEECVAFPLFLLLLDYWRGRAREGWIAVGAMLAVALAAGVRVLYATAKVAGSGSGFGGSQTPWTYVVAQGISILRYLRQLVVPYGFTVDPQIEVSGITSALAWVAIAGLVAFAAWRWRREGDAAGFWFLNGLLLLAPSSSVLPADDLAADRRMYLPLIAFAAGLGFLLERAANGRWWGSWKVVAPVLLVLSWPQIQVWRSEYSLWKQAVERSPGKVRPRIQLARAASGRGGEASAILREAEQRFPENADVANEYGRVLLGEGKAGEALGKFGRALAIEPSNPMFLNNRGVALWLLGQVEPAQADFRRALERDPCLRDAAENLKKTGVAVLQLPSSCP